MWALLHVARVYVEFRALLNVCALRSVLGTKCPLSLVDGWFCFLWEFWWRCSSKDEFLKWLSPYRVLTLWDNGLYVQLDYDDTWKLPSTTIIRKCKVAYALDSCTLQAFWLCCLLGGELSGPNLLKFGINFPL